MTKTITITITEEVKKERKKEDRCIQQKQTIPGIPQLDILPLKRDQKNL